MGVKRSRDEPHEEGEKLNGNTHRKILESPNNQVLHTDQKPDNSEKKRTSIAKGYEDYQKAKRQLLLHAECIEVQDHIKKMEDLIDQQKEVILRYQKNLVEVKTKLAEIEDQKQSIFELLHQNVLSIYSFKKGCVPTLYVEGKAYGYLRSFCTSKENLWITGSYSGSFISGSMCLREVVRSSLKVALMLNALGLVHGGLGYIDNYVFDRNGTPKIKGLENCNVGNNLLEDFRGVAQLISNIIELSNTNYSAVPLEWKSLLCLLKAFPTTTDPGILLDHPAIVSPDERYLFSLEASAFLKEDKENEYPRWSNFCSRRGNIHIGWNLSVDSNAQFLRRNMPRKRRKVNKVKHKDEDRPAALVNFVRNSYSHVREKCKFLINGKKVTYGNDKLEEVFLELFPRLFVEFFCFKHNLEGESSVYWQ